MTDWDADWNSDFLRDDIHDGRLVWLSDGEGLWLCYWHQEWSWKRLRTKGAWQCVFEAIKPISEINKNLALQWAFIPPLPPKMLTISIETSSGGSGGFPAGKAHAGKPNLVLIEGKKD